MFLLSLINWHNIRKIVIPCNLQRSHIRCWSITVVCSLMTELGKRRDWNATHDHLLPSLWPQPCCCWCFTSTSITNVRAKWAARLLTLEHLSCVASWCAPRARWNCPHVGGFVAPTHGIQNYYVPPRELVSRPDLGIVSWRVFPFFFYLCRYVSGTKLCRKSLRSFEYAHLD